MRRIDLTSAGFLLAEKRETPMHVGGVNLFTLPDDVDEQEFYADCLEILRSVKEFRRPFGEYPVSRPTGFFWETDDNIDMDYHVRHSALPSPGRYRELFILASRLHSILMDRTRPLWELHLIEGLQNRQFAIYNKIHHAAIDGVASMQLTMGMCSTSPKEKLRYSPFSLEAYERAKQAGLTAASKLKPREAEMRNVIDALKQQYDSGVHMMTAMRRFGGAFLGRSGNLAVPWHNVPRTSINTKVSGARRFVAQSFEFDRIQAVRKVLGATVNDVVLAMCSGALRRYLLVHDELPLHSLKAMAPVSLRQKDDFESTNAVGFITADLATNIYDPEKRLRTIQESMQAGKDLLNDLSPREAALFVQLTQLPAVVTSILGLAARLPAFSTVVSNVPGPREPLYWNGARLEGIYPASIVFDGFAMNITLVSYNKSLDFGIVACRRSLPHIQRFIDHLEESLQELEEVAGLRSGRGKKPGTVAGKQTAPSKASAKRPTRKKQSAGKAAKATAKKKTARRKATAAKTGSKAAAKSAPKRRAAAKKTAARPKSASAK
jgi:diacylglycerol O-acyltransferase